MSTKRIEPEARDYLGMIAKFGKVLAGVAFAAILINWYFTKFLTTSGEHQPPQTSAWSAGADARYASLPFAGAPVELEEQKPVVVKEGEWTKRLYAVGIGYPFHNKNGKDEDMEYEIEDITGKKWIIKKWVPQPTMVYLRMRSTKGDFFYTKKKL